MKSHMVYTVYRVDDIGDGLVQESPLDAFFKLSEAQDYGKVQAELFPGTHYAIHGTLVLHSLEWSDGTPIKRDR